MIRPHFRSLTLLCAAGAVALAAGAVVVADPEKTGTETPKTDAAKARSAPATKTPAPVSPIAGAVTPPRSQAAAEAEVKVYTNTDLEQMFGMEPVSEETPPAETAEPAADEGAEEPRDVTIPPLAPGGEPESTVPATGTPAGAPDPLAELLARRQREADGERETATSQPSVEELRERVRKLEQQLLGLRNPLLGRRSGGSTAEAPDEESREDWSTLDGQERVARVERALADARAALAAAESAP